jgi:hypothetical protein
MRKALHVVVFGVPVGVIGVLAVRNEFPIGPVVLALSVIPLLGLLLTRRPLSGAIPDLIFGAIDTGLLTIPALWGAVAFGAAGAIAGGIIGDSLTDAIAGFFEGSIAEWLRKRGIAESRDAVVTALGKMCGCLFGSGIVLVIALALGIRPRFS